MPPSDQDKDSRELCGILFADVVGYSRMMGEDEHEAVASVGALERVFAAIVPKHEGRFQVQAGDSFLGTFPTALGAALAAIEIQRSLHETPVRFLARDVVKIRIGVHLGDVLRSAIGMSSNDINLAARIQDKAMHGGIDVSEDVYRQVRNKIRNFEFQNLGEKEFKNIGEPRRVYRIRLPWLGDDAAAGTTAPAQLLGATPFDAVAGTRSEPLAAVPTSQEPADSIPWHRRMLLYRREVVIAAAAAGVAVLVGPRLVDTVVYLFTTPPPPEPAPPPGPAIAKPVAWPMAVAVMQIRGAAETPAWMCDITHQGLNATLSKFTNLQVFSKDVIDWKKEKTGQGWFDIARELGVLRMINGELMRSGVMVTLQARILDAASGVQIGTCEAQGTEDKLFEIQSEVARQLVELLKVPHTTAEMAKIRTPTNVDLDVTKRYADAFGGDEEEPPAPDPKPGAWWLSWPPEAHAQSQEDTAVKALLEQYRAALESEDLDALAGIYVSLGDNTRAALKRYFDSADGLTVRFSGISVLYEGNEALATFTRSDNFKDIETGRDVNLEVRVSTVVAKTDAGWKVKALRKPS